MRTATEQDIRFRMYACAKEPVVGPQACLFPSRSHLDHVAHDLPKEDTVPDFLALRKDHSFRGG
jgi:hypothetical protein